MPSAVALAHRRTAQSLSPGPDTPEPIDWLYSAVDRLASHSIFYILASCWPARIRLASGKISGSRVSDSTPLAALSPAPVPQPCARDHVGGHTRGSRRGGETRPDRKKGHGGSPDLPT